MAKRNEHLFDFTAEQIMQAAHAEAEYHKGRIAYWQNELEIATKRVEQTASLKVERQAHSGGWSPVVSITYGDPGAYRRMGESGGKISTHEKELEVFQAEAKLYGTQGTRIYQLDAPDVVHFRFNGRAREE